MPFLTKFFFKKANQNLDGIRTCNMSFWREDLFEVNGFNEDFVGWGREDTELAVRLFNKGKFRKNIKFSGIAYHLHHEEKSRSNISVNDGHLCKSINSKSTWCNNGLFKVKK